MQRIIREQEATAPSTLISRMGNESTDVARRRGTEPGALQSLLRGDLDWIVMKALEKDRTRRYETVAAMADDVRRHLSDQPVLAGRPSALYKLAKFVRRNRVTVLAGTIATAALLIGFAVAVIGFWRARDEAARSQRISDTLEDLLVSVDPGQAASMSVDVEDVLQRAREAFGEEHATVAAAVNTLAVQLDNSGDFESSEPLYRESLRIWEGIHGREHLNVALTLGRLGGVLRKSGKPEAALATLRESLAILERLPSEPEVASCTIRAELAELVDSQGDHQGAADQYRKILAIYEASPSVNRYAVIETLEQLVGVLLSGGYNDQVFAVLERVYVEVREAYPIHSPYWIASAMGLGNWNYQMGAEEEALKYFAEVLELSEGTAISPSIYRPIALDRTFQILRKRTDEESMDRADRVLEQCIEAFESVWSPTELIGNLNHLAERKRGRDRYAEAIAPAAEAVSVARNGGLGNQAISTLSDRLGSDAFRVALNRDLARADYDRARDALEALVVEWPEDTAFAATLGALHYRLDDLETARDLYAALDLSEDSRLRQQAPAFLAFHALIAHGAGDHEAAEASAKAMEDPSLESSLDPNLFGRLQAEVNDTLNRTD